MYYGNVLQPLQQQQCGMSNQMLSFGIDDKLDAISLLPEYIVKIQGAKV